ncbi:MAG: hypothetical protein ACJAUV_000365 [Flavobacteriales bacterium]|jgi:hypothetical protein
MKKFIIPFVFVLVWSEVSNAQLSPLITSWVQNKTDTGFAGALTNVQEVNYSNTFVYVKTEDIPSWIPEEYDWPNNPWLAVPMNYQFKLRLDPTPNMGPDRKTGFGHIGLWKNGCSIYNPKDAKTYQDSNVWFQNAWYWEHLIGESFDSCIGHPNGSGEYHTHASPVCLYDKNDSTHASPLVGYAFDSYPIYGGYGHANPLDTTSEIVRLKSSYRLRDMTTRTSLPDGTILSTEYYGPSITERPLGAYMEDYEYVEGFGDLDEHNGRFAITKDYPQGIYAYFTTLAWVADTFDYSIKPIFPFVIGTTYYGRVYPADGNTGPGSGFVEIDEDVTLYYSSSTIVEAGKINRINLYPNPTKGLLNIELSDNPFSQESKGVVYDAQGRIVDQFSLIQGELNVYDFSELTNGIYSLRIQSGSLVQTHKIVVEK